MKRFTETTKWQDPWFRRLSIQAKMLWYYITDHCDNIGFIEIDLEMISSDCRGKIKKEHLSELADRLQYVAGDKYFIPKFIRFQYGKLSASCPAHKRVIQAIDENGLTEDSLGYYYPNARVTVRDEIPYRIGRGMDKKGSSILEEGCGEKPQELSKSGYPPIIEQIWALTPAHGRDRSSKKKLADAWSAVRPKAEEAEVIASLKAWSQSHAWTKDGGQYVKAIDRWVRDRGWESRPEGKEGSVHAGIQENIEF